MIKTKLGVEEVEEVEVEVEEDEVEEEEVEEEEVEEDKIFLNLAISFLTYFDDSKLGNNSTP